MVSIVGVSPADVHQCKCKNCASVLEYTKSEMQRYVGKDYSGGSDGREWIVCPKCGKDVIINSW